MQFYIISASELINVSPLQMDRAKLMQDPNYSKKGFKFYHIWNLVKDFEKFTNEIAKATQAYRG